MSEREQLLESLIIRFLQAQGMGNEDAGSLLLCGCPSCLVLLCMMAEVEGKLADMPPSGTVLN